MKKRLSSLFIAALLVLFGVMTVTQRPATFYPMIEIEAPLDPAPATSTNPAVSPTPLKITFLFDAIPTMQRCEALTGNLARVTLTKCAICTVSKLQCIKTLDANQQKMLSEQPLDSPSGRMANGVVTYSATNTDVALATCQQTQSQSAKGPQPVICYGSKTARPKPAPKPIDISQIGYSFLAFLVAAVSSGIATWLIVRYEHLHAHYSHDHTDTGPQKFHDVPTPRIGGIGLVIGLIAAGWVMISLEELPHEREFGFLLMASLPAFLGGLVEDITKKVGVLERLLMTMLSGAIAAWLLGSMLNRIDIPGIDRFLLWLPFAFTFTVFAVGGIANAINIIDGYNGLVGGYAIIVLISFAWVAAQVGDMLIFPTALAMTGALFGFIKWNWPVGKIFLGDGGAYLLGFVLAELSVLLVIRNPNVSPWFPLLLLIYPVFETFFSIYRKKILRGRSPGKPDGLHFHMLIYKRLVPREAHSDAPMGKLERNSRVAKYLWVPAVVIASYGAIYWQSTPFLIAGAALFCIFYATVYLRIVSWKNVQPIISSGRHVFQLKDRAK